MATARVIAAAATPSIDTKHAADAADSRAHAGAYCAADNRTDGSCRASAFAYAFSAALVRAAENALSVAGVRKCKQRKRRGGYRETGFDAAMVWQCRCLRLHLNSLLEPERRADNAAAAKRLRQRRIPHLSPPCLRRFRH
jgi:hypothetical protein